jgi:hypothetical protein
MATKTAPTRAGTRADFAVRRVDSVRTLAAKATGLKQVVLAFRVGFADEQLSERGLSHCCEHLALRQFRDATFEYNGFVDAARTVFFARGTDRQLVEFARGVTAALSAPAEDDYARERRVLQAESAQRAVGDVQQLLRMRYGSVGPGSCSYPEYGLYEEDFDAVARWSRTWFTAANAVAWCSGPVPRGLGFELESGESMPPPRLTEIDEARPVFLRRPGGYALGTTMTSDPIETLATFVLERRLLRRLRHDLGATYAVQSQMTRLALDTGHFSLHADVGPNQAQQVTDEVFQVGEGLAAMGHTAAELAEWKGFRAQADLQRDAVLGPLDNAAQRILFGGAPRSTAAWEATILKASQEDVAGATAGLLERAAHLLPQQADAPVGLTPLAVRSARAVTGQTFSAAASSGERLVVGAEGVTWAGSGGKQVTVPVDEAELVLSWADRSRLVVGRDAFAVAVTPMEWQSGDDALTSFDTTFATVPTVRVGRRRRVPSGVRPRTSSERAKAFVRDPLAVRKSTNPSQRRDVRLARYLVLAFGAMFLIASLDTPQTGGERVQSLVIGLLCVAAARLGALIGRPWRRRRTPVDAWVIDHAYQHVQKSRVPADLPSSAASIVGGTLLGWLAARDLVSEWFAAESGEDLARWRAGELTGPGLYREWDGLLASDMLSPTGQRFLSWYFSGTGIKQPFTRDFVALRGPLASNYHVPDTAETQSRFDALADASFRAWSRHAIRRDHRRSTDLPQSLARPT